MSATKRGAFVLFEGIDRCGKSTQVKLLVDFLNKSAIQSEVMRFPNRETATGKSINDYLTNREFQMNDQCIHLLFSANRWEQRDYIERTLKSGKTIICDRYAFSGVAFTAAKGLDLEWCKDPDRGLPAPDVVFYLDISVQEAKKRGQYGEERYEIEEFQSKVKRIYEESLKDSSWEVVDATQPMEEIQTKLQRSAIKVIEQSAVKPIQQLWVKKKS